MTKLLLCPRCKRWHSTRLLSLVCRQCIANERQKLRKALAQ